MSGKEGKVEKKERRGALSSLVARGGRGHDCTSSSRPLCFLCPRQNPHAPGSGRCPRYEGEDGGRGGARKSEERRERKKREKKKEKKSNSNLESNVFFGRGFRILSRPLSPRHGFTRARAASVFACRINRQNQKKERTSSLAARDLASKLRSSSSAVEGKPAVPASSTPTRSSTSTSSRRPAAYTGPEVALAVDLLPREGEEEEEGEEDETAGGDEGDDDEEEEEEEEEFARASLEEADARVMVAAACGRRRRRASLPLLLLQGCPARVGGRCRSMAARAIVGRGQARAREREEKGKLFLLNASEK